MTNWRSETFRAMGTEVSVTLPATVAATTLRALTRSAERVFACEERRFSRFRSDSELCQVNARAGRRTNVSPAFAELAMFALQAARRTDGLFDPTVLGAMVAMGYDRDFDHVLAGARAALHPSPPCGRWREVSAGPGWVELPPDVGFDFGAVAKGWTVDLAVEALDGSEVPWAIVNAGGDLRLAGGGGLPVGLEEPERPEDQAVRLHLDHGALATTSITRRRWGEGLHHVLDPRTGEPSRTGVLQATAWAHTCAEAEVRATWAMLKGEDVMDRFPAILVKADGPIVTNLAGVEAA